MKLRHLLAIAAMCGVPALVSGCQPTSSPAIPTNVIAIAQTVSETATNVIADAQAVWPVILATLPAANQSAAQDAFNKAVFTANHVILVLNDAIQTAVAANTPNPDFTAIFSQVADAVAQVVAIVQQFQTPAAALARTSGGVDAVADMHAAVARIKAAAAK